MLWPKEVLCRREKNTVWALSSQEKLNRRSLNQNEMDGILRFYPLACKVAKHNVPRQIVYHSNPLIRKRRMAKSGVSNENEAGRDYTRLTDPAVFHNHLC